MADDLRLAVIRGVALFLFFTLVDSLITEYVLGEGGEELNPVFRFAMRQGFTISQAKVLLLAPLLPMWFRLMGSAPKQGLAVLEFAVLVMFSVVLFEVVGMIYLLIL